MDATIRSPSPVRRIPHTRPLLFHEGKLFCGRFNEILSTADAGLTFKREAILELSTAMEPLLRRMPLARRIARYSVYRMRIAPDGTRYFLFPGGVFVQPVGAEVARRSWASERGSRPVSLAVGRNGLAVFGEYWRNPHREAVRIFGSRDGGRHWEVVAEFRPGEIRHVHGISYDPWGDCFWICTGDYDHQNRLIRASADFRDMRTLREGGQENRFFSVLVTSRALFAATDSPDDPNYLCEFDKQTGAAKVLASLQNSSFFICTVDGKVVVSTNAEPSTVNDTAACHVWVGDPARGKWRCVLTWAIDRYARAAALPGVPSGLFQWPQVFFAEGDNPCRLLACHAIGLEGLDDSMLIFDTADLDIP